MIKRAEIEVAKENRPRHRRLRFNATLVAEHLGLGPMPPAILDVTGVCALLRIEREALEELLRTGLPHSDINPRAVRELRNGGGRP